MRIGIPNLGLSLTSAPTAFSPASLSPSAWYDPSDLSSMFQLSNGTTAAAVDSPVGYLGDKSGNGNHLIQATVANRPILRQSGSLYYLEFDGTNDGMICGSISLPASADFAAAFHNSGAATQYMLADGNGSKFLGVAQSGSTSGTYVAVGTPTTLVDGTLLDPDTRGAFYTAMGSSGPKVVQQNGADLSTLTNLRISQFASYLLNGRLYGLLITPAGTADDRAAVLAHLSDKAGV